MQNPWGQPGPYIPFVGDWGNANGGQQPESERYHVYVNGVYIGDKASVAQGDGGPSAVQTYLRSRGFGELDIHTEGDHIEIRTDRQEQEEDLKRHLSIYLETR